MYSPFNRLCTEFVVGGGFFTGRYSKFDDAVEAGARFDSRKAQGQVRPVKFLYVSIKNRHPCLDVSQEVKRRDFVLPVNAN